MAIELDEADFEVLFPAKLYELGKKSLTLRPLGIEDLSIVTKQLEVVWKELKDTGVTKVNWKDHIQVITTTIIENVPEVLEIASGVGKESIKRLPPKEAISLMVACVEINIEHNTGMEKNLLALAEKATEMATTQAA